MWKTEKLIFCFTIIISISILFLFFSSPAAFLKPMSTFLITTISTFFRFSAHLFVILIQSLRWAAHGLHSCLLWVANGLRAAVSALVSDALEAAASAASAVARQLKELGPKIARVLHEAFDAAMEWVKAAIGWLQEAVPKIAKAVAEFFAEVVGGLWGSYVDALTYVMEKGKVTKAKCS